MRTWQPGMLMIALLACNGGKDDGTVNDNPAVDGDADTDADSDADADCTATISSVSPEDGTDLVAVDAPVTVTWSPAIAETDSYAIDVVGATGTTALASDGLSATWTGTLDLDRTYTVNASVCDSDNTSTFTTLPGGVDPTLLEGKTFAVTWAGLTITEPQNGSVLRTLVEIDYVLAQVLTIDTATWLADSVATVGIDDATGILADCGLATQQVADFSQNPYFSIDGTITIIVDAATGATAEIENFQFLARASDDGNSLTDVRISGLIATETILADTPCSDPLLLLLLPSCVPCTTSVTGECLLFEATAPSALAVPNLDLAGTCGL